MSALFLESAYFIVIICLIDNLHGSFNLLLKYRYGIAPTTGENMTSFRTGNGYQRQTWTDQTSYNHHTWSRPTRNDSYHYQRTPDGFRAGHSYPGQRPHRYHEFTGQNESFIDNRSYSRFDSHYSSSEYEGRRVGRPNRPSSSHRSHYMKPYYSDQGSYLRNSSRGAPPVRDNGPRWQQPDPSRSGYSRYSRNAWDTPAEGLRNRPPREYTRWK